MSKVKKAWSRYKHRFIPWLFLNWHTRRIAVTTFQRDTSEHVARLRDLVSRIAMTLPGHYLYRDSTPPAAGSRGREAMKSCFGFVCERRESGVHMGGSGVFVTEGRVPEGALVAIYPGTVYLPFDPLLLVSIRNPYLLRRCDGMFLDGKSVGLSGLLYRSCANRGRVGGRLRCDLSWMGDELVNPLSLGQRVNNQSEERPANVEYIEMTVSAGAMLAKEQRLLPWVDYRPGSSEDMRVVGLVATRDVREGEELLSNYLTFVNIT